MASTTSSYTDHPCFGSPARNERNRVHLPVAPRANTRSRFAGEGVRHAMTPEEALAWLGQITDAGTQIEAVSVTGPGDPLAVPDPVISTLKMVREKFPEMCLCLTTTGIGGARLADPLAETGLSHITILVDAVDPKIAEELYAWIRPAQKTVPLEDAAKVLVEEQAAAIKAFKAAGLSVKVDTTVYPGINSGHIREIARAVAELGADVMAIAPFQNSAGLPDAPSEPEEELMAGIRDMAARHIQLMAPVKNCGEHIAGTGGFEAPAGGAFSTLPKPTEKRPNVAVASSSGMEVDLHLGHAVRFLVYGPREDGLACLLGTRDAPEPGTGNSRWEKLAETLDDCFILLAASAGENPRNILSRHGLSILITDGEIEGVVDTLYGGGKKKKCKK